MKQRVELLAPAGSIESFYAAVNSGADSVYLGGKLFNARYNSQNFDNEEMKSIIAYAHNKDVKVYVTLNIVLKDTEIVDALNYAAFLYENDVDAVIVQDMGMLYLIKKFIPELPVNISTQAAVYDEYGVKFYEHYNVNKVIMARELSVEHLKTVVKNTDTNLEIFIHGALCTCYSGQCYMSSFLGGRSGNRGKCAQPCRLSYSFYDKENKEENEEFGVVPVLSLKDFIAGETIPELIEAGITTFKIEGRMKGPEFTSAVVEYYRQIIDDYYLGKKSDYKELEKRAIATFSRGYTNGYLKPSKDDEMLAKTSSGVKGENIEEIQEEVKNITQEFSDFRRKKIDFTLSLKIGEQAVLKAFDGKNTVVVNSEEACETSIKNAVTKDMINEQLNKLGNSIYELNSLEISLDEDVFVRKSTLNQLRRAATEMLYAKGAVYYDRKKINGITRDEIFSFKNMNEFNQPKLSLKINNNDEFYLADNVKVKRIYIPYDLNIELVNNINIEEKYLWIPNIISKEQYNLFKSNMKHYEELFDGVCVNNVGSYYFFKENSKLKLHCGPFFNIINTFSANLLEERGAGGFTFSVEANIRDMESINKHSSLKSEIIAHEFVQLMVMKNCPMSLIKNCKNIQDCEKCSYKNSYALKDRKGVYFNVERENRLTHIYNSVPLTLIGKVDDFVRAKIEYFMVDTKWLDNSEEIIDAMYCEINGVQTANVLVENNFTRGHYLKNIL
ncbi:MAG: peptidase [Sedimentibacter sp.]|nr:peptidase [Sedimentibacter sp.]